MSVWCSGRGSTHTAEALCYRNPAFALQRPDSAYELSHSCAAITTLGDKCGVPVTQRFCSVDTDAARAPDRDTFLPRIHLRDR